MATNYGLPYLGSKSSISEWVVDHFPEADNYYELFAGGCAATHVAILSNKFKHYYVNDWENTVQTFIDAVNGKYETEDRWISREDYNRLKEDDLYVRYVWSFSSTGKSYMYGTKVEQFKRALHYLLFFKDNQPFKDLGIDVPVPEWDSLEERYTSWRNYYNNYPSAFAEFEKSCSEDIVDRFDVLESMNGLLRFRSMHSLKPYFKPEEFHIFKGDYRNVPITTEDNFIYLDPPYENTAGYVSGDFDHRAFYNYIIDELVPKSKLVMISEYQCSDDRFVCVARIKKRKNLGISNSSRSYEDQFTTECLFIPKAQVDWYKTNCIVDWSGDL